MTQNGIRVVIIEPVGGHCGMDYYDFGLSRGLLAAGCGVSLFTCDETRAPAIPGLKFHPIYKQVFGRTHRLMRGFRYLRASVTALTKAVMRGEKVCHLHLFQGEKEELALVVLARCFGRRVVITVHDIEAFSPVTPRRSMILKVYGLAKGYIVHNNVSKLELERFGVASDKISVIPHGHFWESMQARPSRLDARLRLGISESARVMLFFGQIKDAKGLDILIEAMPAVAREVSEAVLVIAGRPLRTEFAKYEELIDGLGLRPLCRLHIGFVPDNDVATYYAAADVVVLPYRRIYQSGVLIMAMSYGRPVVVSDLPGMTEMISDGENGYVFAQGSKDALAAKLVQVLKDEPGRERAATRALEYVRERHDWGKIGETTARLYETVLRAGS
jgi:glycosyltransferase involved in cell wall biosynthesis